MFGKFVRGLRRIYISGTVFAVWAITIVGSTLMFMIRSSDVQNAVQIAACGALVGTAIRKFAKTNAIITAAMYLAEQLAKANASEPPHGPGEHRLATVIDLPEQRRDRDKRTEAS